MPSAVAPQHLRLSTLVDTTSTYACRVPLHCGVHAGLCTLSLLVFAAQRQQRQIE